MWFDLVESKQSIIRKCPQTGEFKQPKLVASKKGGGGEGAAKSKSKSVTSHAKNPSFHFESWLTAGWDWGMICFLRTKGKKG